MKRLSAPWTAALLVAGLGCSTPQARDRPWSFHDLTARPPDRIGGPSWAIDPISGTTRLEPLGPADLPTAGAVPRQSQRDFPADFVPAVLQRSATHLVYFLVPGDKAFLSFIPLPAFAGPGPSLYRIAVRTGEEKPTVLFQQRFARDRTTAGAEQVVDLSAWSGRPIELILRVGTSSTETAALRAPEAWGELSVAWLEPVIGTAPPVRLKTNRALRPNFLLLGLDTTRADALGPWNESPSLTPAVDRLAAESDVWMKAYSCFNITNPSFVSTMTGLYGQQHGVYGLHRKVDESAVTLAEVFRAGGYETRGSLAARHLGAAGLEQGFDRFEAPMGRLAAGAIVDRALTWLGERPEGRPFFAWLHFFDPHTPNTPMQPYASGWRPKAPPGIAPVTSWFAFRAPGSRKWSDLELFAHPDLYHAEVAYLDRQLGRLFEFLRSRGLLENTYVVLWADHGENLGEHGIQSRHIGLFETTTHVPLMIRSPGTAHPRRHPELVQNVDLFPTLVAAAGLAAPRTAGSDLFGAPGRRAIFSEAPDQSDVRVRTDRWAFARFGALAPPLTATVYLFDLQADPGETTNLAGHGLPEEKSLAALLDRWLASMRASRLHQALPGIEKASESDDLAALGYLQ